MSNELILTAIKGAMIGGGMMIITYAFILVINLFRKSFKAVKKRIMPIVSGQYISVRDATIRLQEEHLYDLVAKELSENNQNLATWTKAIEKSEGNMDKAKSFYIKFRIQSLKDEQIVKNKIMHHEKQLESEVSVKDKVRKSDEQIRKDKEDNATIFILGVITIIMLVFWWIVMNN